MNEDFIKKLEASLEKHPNSAMHMLLTPRTAKNVLLALKEHNDMKEEMNALKEHINELEHILDQADIT